MAEINLDAARAARSEVQREAHVLVFAEKTFILPHELPIDFVLTLQTGDVRAALEALLGPEFPEFWSLRPSQDDIIALMEGVGRAYGIGLPESPASGASSPNGGDRSRPTSVVTTMPTSGSSAGAAAPQGRAVS